MGQFSTGTTQQTQDFLDAQRWQEDPSDVTVERVQAIAPPQFQDVDQPFDPLQSIMGRRTPSEELERLSGPLIRAAEAEKRPTSRQEILDKSLH